MKLIDWLFNSERKRKKRALEECLRSPNGNLEEYDSVWQNNVKDCMETKGFTHDGRPGPSAGEIGAYSRKK